MKKMVMAVKDKSSPKRVFKVIVFQIATVILSILIVGCFLEVFLRFVPIPGVKMGSKIFDPDKTLYKFAPDSRFLRINMQNERIIRYANSDGFLDVNHDLKKKDGIYRIGFFGDSYVEAIQVPLKDTFFRVIQKNLNKNNFELFSFGTSGHGTLHGYLLSKKYSELYDFDLVVYVFYENDPGDQVEKFKKANTLPYAVLKGNEIKIDTDLILAYMARHKYDEIIKKIILFNKSILLQTVYNRFQLLRHHGIKVSVTDDDMNMTSVNIGKNAPSGSDLPSTWPRNFYNEATKKCEAVLLKWFQEVDTQKREFAIFYIPRKSEWKKDDQEQNSWKVWLENFCIKNKIDFIDPTEAFFQYASERKKIYGDHFAKDGHKAFADAFLDWFKMKSQNRNM